MRRVIVADVAHAADESAHESADKPATTVGADDHVSGIDHSGLAQWWSGGGVVHHADD